MDGMTVIMSVPNVLFKVSEPDCTKLKLIEKTIEPMEIRLGSPEQDTQVIPNINDEYNVFDEGFCHDALTLVVKFEGEEEAFLTLSDTKANLNPPAEANDASIILKTPDDVKFNLGTYAGMLSFELNNKSLMNIEFDVVITEPDCNDLKMNEIVAPFFMEITLGSR